MQPNDSWAKCGEKVEFSCKNSFRREGEVSMVCGDSQIADVEEDDYHGFFGEISGGCRGKLELICFSRKILHEKFFAKIL